MIVEESASSVGVLQTGYRKQLLIAAFLFCAYGCLNLAVNGVILDEAAVHAQIITGAVRYDAGHPHDVFYKKAYSLPAYLSAAIAEVAPSASVISGLRNILFVFLSLFTPFILTMLITGEAFWGYVAAAFTVTEAVILFGGAGYPMLVFPLFYSHGHFASHVTVLAFTLLSWRFWKSGGFLLGALPAVHPAIALAFGPFAAYFLVRNYFTQTSKERRNCIAAVCSGLIICVVLGLIILSQGATQPIAPYDSIQPDGAAIAKNYDGTMIHGLLVQLISFPYLVNFGAVVALSLMLIADLRRSEGISSISVLRTAFQWLFMFFLYLWGFVFLNWLYQRFIGELPHVLYVVRPYRLANFSAIFLGPLSIATLAAGIRRLPEQGRKAAVALVLCFMLFSSVAISTHRVGSTRVLMAGLWGLLFAIQFIQVRSAREFRNAMVYLALPGLPIIAISLMEQQEALFAMLMALAGGMIWLKYSSYVFERFRENYFRENWMRNSLLAASLILAVCSLLSEKVWDIRAGVYDPAGINRGRWDTLSEGDRTIIAWLREHARPTESILAALLPRSEWQSKTGHPVVFEVETLPIITYMPGNAAIIGMMARDLYGVDYSNASAIAGLIRRRTVSLNAPSVYEVWEKRTKDEWRQLGKKYRFRLICSPTRVPLRLPVMVRSAIWTLYAIEDF